MVDFMRLHWLSIGILAVSTTLFAQYPQSPYPQGPYPPSSYPNGAPSQGQFPQGPGQAPPPQGGNPQGNPQGNAPVDQPGRPVARLGVLNGDASIKRGDSTDWVAAAVNAPLMSGDQISVAAGGRAEIQLDAAHFLRIAGDTELRLADLDNGHFQIQIAHGMVTWRVLRDSQAQAEIDTPLVGVHPGPQSAVRVNVDADGTTHITARKGTADVSTQKGSEKLSENQTMDVRGAVSDPEFQVVAAAARDDWDNWSDQRDTSLLRAQSQRYVTKDITGVEDLDPYGHWAWDPAYGWVWMPTVAASWAPYQNGQWVWEDYYGWVWVDSAPWGWAPFHYGYWYNRVGLGWAWYPGPRLGHVWWRPAMVGFFGWGGGVGIGVGFGFGNIGWIPLAPHEVFRPWYGAGFAGGAVGFNVVRNANIAGTFRNASVAGGVTAVTAADFARGNFRNAVAVDRGTLQQASLVRGALPVTPTSQNLRFSNRAASVTGGSMANERFFGSSAASAGARRTPFTQQQAAVRSAVSNGSAAQSREPQSQGGAGQSRGSSQASGWQRFEGSPASNGSASGSRGANTSGSNSSPRQFQVSPSIIRQRPDASPASSQPYGSNGSQARTQQTPAQASGTSSSAAPRSAPAGGGSRGSGSRNGGKR
jgi:hypothetical protein